MWNCTNKKNRNISFDYNDEKSQNKVEKDDDFLSLEHFSSFEVYLQEET